MTRATAALVAGVGLGAGLMYYLDPARGSRRRTHARNQILHASHRIQGRASAQMRFLLEPADTADDTALIQRVRSVLADVVSEAQVLAVDITRGVVTVSGPILRDEMRYALNVLKRVPGVRRVVNELEPYGTSNGGGVRRMAAVVAGVAGLGLAARAAIQARGHELELRS